MSGRTGSAGVGGTRCPDGAISVTAPAWGPGHGLVQAGQGRAAWSVLAAGQGQAEADPDDGQAPDAADQAQSPGRPGEP
jgi:hypothetical protein